MAFPRSWLKVFFPMMFLVKTTTGANTPFPLLAPPIIGRGRTGRVATLSCGGAALACSRAWSSPATEVPQLPRKAEAETEVTAMDEQ